MTSFPPWCLYFPKLFEIKAIIREAIPSWIRHHAKACRYSTTLMLVAARWDRCYFYPHFKDGKTEVAQDTQPAKQNYTRSGCVESAFLGTLPCSSSTSLSRTSFSLTFASSRYGPRDCSKIMGHQNRCVKEHCQVIQHPLLLGSGEGRTVKIDFFTWLSSHRRGEGSRLRGRLLQHAVW